MKNKIYSKLIILLALILCLAACDGAVHLPGQVKISLDYSSLNVSKGYTKTLTATITPESAAETPITWESSNTDIATVDDDGVVTGKAAGEAIITATITVGQVEYSASCKVTVAVSKVTITFDGNGSTSGSMDPVKVDSGVEINLPPNAYEKAPVLYEYYVFSSWNTMPDGYGTVYYNEGKITTDTDITLYAQWQTVI